MPKQKVCIPRFTFRRLVFNALDECTRGNMFIANDAVDILQQDIESRIVEIFANAGQNSVDAKRTTLTMEDFNAALEEFVRESKSYQHAPES